MPRNFHEALVETEVMADGVLPALLVLLVVGEVLHYVLVDTVEGQSLLGAASDRHHDQCVVGVSWFFGFFLVDLRRGARRWGLGARDVELGVGGRGGAGRGFGQEVADGEAVRRRHGATSRAAGATLPPGRARGHACLPRPPAPLHTSAHMDHTRHAYPSNINSKAYPLGINSGSRINQAFYSIKKCIR